MVRLPDGEEHVVRIRDFSTSSVGLETDIHPALGAQIIVGDTPAIVVRHFDNGIVAGFVHPFANAEIDESTRL